MDELDWRLDFVHWTPKNTADVAKTAIMADIVSEAFKFVTKIAPQSLKTFNMSQKNAFGDDRARLVSLLKQKGRPKPP